MGTLTTLLRAFEVRDVWIRDAGETARARERESSRALLTGVGTSSDEGDGAGAARGVALTQLYVESLSYAAIS